MNDKQAITILERMILKYSPGTEEEEALRLAIGILAWSTLAETRQKRMSGSRTMRKGRDIGTASGIDQEKGSPH